MPELLPMETEAKAKTGGEPGRSTLDPLSQVLGLELEGGLGQKLRLGVDGLLTSSKWNGCNHRGENPRGHMGARGGGGESHRE
jgi:hypothetical protein